MATIFYNNSDIITNQEFLDAYDKLGFSQINKSRKSATLTWDEITQIFNEIKVELHSQPTQKVMMHYCCNYCHEAFKVTWITDPRTSSKDQ